MIQELQPFVIKNTDGIYVCDITAKNKFILLEDFFNFDNGGIRVNPLTFKVAAEAFDYIFKNADKSEYSKYFVEQLSIKIDERDNSTAIDSTISVYNLNVQGNVYEEYQKLCNMANSESELSIDEINKIKRLLGLTDFRL